MSGRPLTGRKVLVIALASFGVVLAANVTMMFFALDGFPGLVERNPYVAAQKFDAEVKAERALGWSFDADWSGGELRVSARDAAGEPLAGLEVTAVVGRPATDVDDRRVVLSGKDGQYRAPVDLPAGRWRIDILARRGDGAVFRIADDLYLSPEEAGG